MQHDFYDIIIIGAGPAGMAAAIAAAKENNLAKIALIEREDQMGGILKQCIHDGFGLIAFKEQLTGPEYAWRYRDMVCEHKNIEVFVSTFVTHIEKINSGFELSFINPTKGVFQFSCKALISATGCRERTDRQVFIQGERPSGVFTAGQAQAFINIKGYLPGKQFIILGSGDIGLIMARRLTLETAQTGGKVLGVYEVKPEPSGLTRNIVQCLNDYNIPLHLSTTITCLHGTNRLEGVTIAKVDSSFQPIKSTEQYIPCDTLILSVGLIPENDILDSLAPDIDKRTKGPKVNQYMETNITGLFSCGNALHVNDLADYVSESGQIAGARAAQKFTQTDISTTNNNDNSIPLCVDKTLLYQVPARIDMTGDTAVLFFRSAKNRENSTLIIRAHNKNNGIENSKIIFKKKYAFLKPPEMERITLKIALIPENTDKIYCSLEDAS